MNPILLAMWWYSWVDWTQPASLHPRRSTNRQSDFFSCNALAPIAGSDLNSTRISARSFERRDFTRPYQNRNHNDEEYGADNGEGEPVEFLLSHVLLLSLIVKVARTFGVAL